MVIRLYLEDHNSAAFDNLRSKLQETQERLALLELSYRSLELKYGAEIQYNAALIDLLKANDIPFRNVLSHAFRYRNGP